MRTSPWCQVTTTARRWLSCCRTDHTSNSRPRKSWLHDFTTCSRRKIVLHSASANWCLIHCPRWSSQIRCSAAQLGFLALFDFDQSSRACVLNCGAPAAPLCSESFATSSPRKSGKKEGEPEVVRIAVANVYKSHGIVLICLIYIVRKFERSWSIQFLCECELVWMQLFRPAHFVSVPQAFGVPLPLWWQALRLRWPPGMSQLPKES